MQLADLRDIMNNDNEIMMVVTKNSKHICI